MSLVNSLSIPPLLLNYPSNYVRISKPDNLSFIEMLLQDNHIAFCINFKQKLPYENQRKIDMILADDKKALLLLDILKSNLWNFTTDITEEE